MNYMKELNAFRQYLWVNELPSSAVVLWYSLMSLNNMTGWKERFNASNRVLGQLTGLSKSGIAKARGILAERGLIECKNGKKGQSAVFKMVSLTHQANWESITDLATGQSIEASPDATKTPSESPTVDPSVDQPVGSTVDANGAGTSVVDESVDPSVAPSVNRTVAESSTIPRHRQDETKKKTKKKNTRRALENKKPLQPNDKPAPFQKRAGGLALFDELLKEVGS